MAIRHYVNTALPVTLAAGVTSGATSFQVASTAGYPAAPFTIAVKRGTAFEEVCLVGSTDATHFATLTRGYDGTTALAHSINDPIEHISSAQDFADANSHIFDTTRNDHTQYLLRNVLTTKGDLFTRDATGVVRIAVGTDGQVVMADSTQTTGIRWSTLSLIAPGIMVDFGGSTPPSGWLLCDGTTVSRTTYAPLFAAIGVAHNTGGEAGTDFRLPDHRGRFPIGAGQGSGLVNRVFATRGGEENHVLTVPELAAHNHTQTAHSHNLGIAFLTGGGGVTIGSGQGQLPAANYIDTQAPAIQNAGANTAHNNMPPFIALNVIIKT